MKNFVLLAFAVPCILLATSCTVEKRVHLPGYHVDWAGGKSPSKTQLEKTDRAAPAELKAEAAEPASRPSMQLETARDVPETAEFTDGITAHVDADPVSFTSFEGETMASREYPGRGNNQPNTTTKTLQTSPPDQYVQERGVEVRKVEGLGLAGMVLGLAGWFVPFLGLAIVMMLLAIIFGAVSLGKFHKYPEVYMGRGFAITSLILGILGLIIVLIIIATL